MDFEPVRHKQIRENALQHKPVKPSYETGSMAPAVAAVDRKLFRQTHGGKLLALVKVRLAQ